MATVKRRNQHKIERREIYGTSLRSKPLLYIQASSSPNPPQISFILQCAAIFETRMKTYQAFLTLETIWAQPRQSRTARSAQTIILTAENF